MTFTWISAEETSIVNNGGDGEDKYHLTFDRKGQLERASFPISGSDDLFKLRKFRPYEIVAKSANQN